jgi:plastocyanin/FtsP/CotA-like multicopper oxidase with cupredoxin domain
MATRDLWIQLENHPWDIYPKSAVNRMDGMPVNPAAAVARTLRSPITGVTRTVMMRKPLAGDALIFRRYTENWAAPDDRKVNPWDLNEPDPTDSGTMGTVPGPVIECDVGDTVRVHFRNLDQRTKLAPPLAKVGNTVNFLGIDIDIGFDIDRFFPRFVPLAPEKRAHSLHTHGFVFAPTSDGAYPLSPPDVTQPIEPSEAAAWAALGVTGFKQADRVPSGGTFTYTWNTLGWPTTAGVWLYHDHSICDMENVNLGAIGIVVIHNPADVENEVEITPARLPGGSFNGSPVTFGLFPFTAAEIGIGILPHDLLTLGRLDDPEAVALGAGAGMVMAAGPVADMGGMAGMAGMAAMTTKITANPESHGEPGALTKLPLTAGFEELAIKAVAHHGAMPDAKGRPRKKTPKNADHLEAFDQIEPDIALERTIRRGDLLLELDEKFTQVNRLFFRRFRTPPDQGLYLQLFHEFGNMGMCINGRQNMGNTPTIVAGPNTRMRFGVVGMGDVPHTFHIHGHRWALTGPAGTNLNSIMTSPQVSPVSQFEDTRLLGPANSFAFTIEEGQGFMRASPANGEWHMHCHVLGHMMGGMMGSLLIVNGGETVSLPVGKPCPSDDAAPPPPTTPTATTYDVSIVIPAFSPASRTIKVGDTVRWTNNEPPGGQPHTVSADGGAFGSALLQPGQVFSRTFTATGTFPYHCNVHTNMTGTVIVNP